MSHYEINKTANHLNVTNARKIGYVEIQTIDPRY